MWFCPSVLCDMFPIVWILHRLPQMAAIPIRNFLHGACAVSAYMQLALGEYFGEPAADSWHRDRVRAYQGGVVNSPPPSPCTLIGPFFSNRCVSVRLACRVRWSYHENAPCVEPDASRTEIRSEIFSSDVCLTALARSNCLLGNDFG